jgi:hypothetical protein
LALWRRLIAGSEWSHLLDVLSPALFEVVPARQLSTRAAELARHWFDQAGARALVESLDARAVEVGLPVRVVSAPIKRSIVPFHVRASENVTDPYAADGQRLLQFFFFQLYVSDTLFLDLRASRFYHALDTGTIVFRPLPLWVKWRPDFVEGIRQLYDGFYGGADALYEQAVADLGIGAARDVFERAFGGPKKHASEYTVASFRDTFHEVFLRCRDAKVAFHPDFVTLGIALATLYDHLETLGGCYDVQAQYESVRESLVGVREVGK